MVVAFAVVAEKPLGPVHLNVAPVAEEVPVNVTEVVVQVIGPETDAVAPGAVLFCTTVTLAVDVQPLAGLVTVSA